MGQLALEVLCGHAIAVAHMLLSLTSLLVVVCRMIVWHCVEQHSSKAGYCSPSMLGEELPRGFAI